MKFYWYELRVRPIGWGTHPEGDFTTEPSHKNESGRVYGAVCYDHPLTTEEIQNFQLQSIQAPREVEEWEFSRNETR